MSLSTVRAKMKTVIESVSGIGQVHDYKRYVHDWASYKELFAKNQKINTWEIQRVHTESDPFGGSGGREDRMHNFVVRGFYAVSDDLASEKTFHELADLIIDAFRNKPDLDGVANILNFPITADFTDTMFGGVLCHVAEINISVSERNLF